MENLNQRFEDEVLRRLHEVARAAREVPVEAQPKRLQDALVSLVALDVISTGTVTMPTVSDSGYTPSAGPSS
jgi:hypothetical protein